MSAKYNSPRKAISAGIEQAVLAKSRRRCTLCFGINGDRKEKRGQIAHLDGNRGNNAESNLAWMCLDHHSLFDSTTKQHKNYTIAEVKEYRRQLYKVLRPAAPRSSGRSGRRLRPAPKLKTASIERRSRQVNATALLTAQEAKVTNSPVASGTGITQTINSPTINISVPERASSPSMPVQFFNWNGSSEPLNVNGRQHSVQDPSLLDLWCLITIVNCTLYPMKIEPLQLLINGEECPPKHIFFRPKSNLRERFKRISVMGNSKEDYQLHFMFPVDSYPKACSGYLLVDTHSSHDPVKIPVSFP